MISDSGKRESDAVVHWVGPRGRRILHTGAWSMVAKIAAAANLFLTVPFVLHALGPAQFGVWATLVSLVAFAGFLDFGLGNGTMNLVAAAHGRGENENIGNILREGRRTLLWVALWLAVAVSIALPLVPWQRVLGAPDTMADSSRAAVAVVLFAIVLAVPLNLVTRVQLGLGLGDRAFRWQALGQTLAGAVVIISAKSGASLVLLVAAAVATPLIASAANTWLLWCDALVATSPSTTRHPAIASHIRREGLLFFVLQLAAALSLSADLPLISALRSPTEAGSYAIVQRLFSIVPLTLALVWAPLWPTYRQALAARDNGWVLRTLRRSVLLAVAFACLAGVVLALGFERIVELWIHRPLVVSGMLLAGFATWCVMDAAGTAIATFLNAASMMRYQVIVATIFAISCVAAKVWAVLHHGIDLIPWVSAATSLVIFMVPTAILLPRIVRRAFTKQY